MSSAAMQTDTPVIRNPILRGFNLAPPPRGYAGNWVTA